MLDLEIKHLLLVKTIVEQGSLTRASEELYLSQSALSHQLRDLESRLGLPVFNRLNKKMVLTEAGEKILETSQNVLCEIKGLQSQLDFMKNGEIGRIRISTECYTCYHWLPKLLRVFQEKYPKVEVQIVAEATRKPLISLKEGKLDIGIVQTIKLDPVENLFEYFHLFSDEQAIILPQDHPLTAKKILEPQDLNDQVLIMYESTEKDSSMVQNVLIPHNIQPRQIMRMQLTEAIVELVDAGMGISVMAQWAVSPFLKNRNIVCRPFRHSSFKRHWGAVVLKNHQNPVIRDFVKCLQAYPFNE